MALASGHEYMTKMISHPLESLATKLSSSLYFQTTCCFSDSYFRYLVKSLACFQQTKMESSTVVMYPSPGIGHLVSMVELGKLIHTHHPSLSVIILILTAPYETGATGKYINTVSATTPAITFHHLPAIALPPDFSSEFIDLAFGLPELYNSVVHNTLVAISQKSTIKAVILEQLKEIAVGLERSGQRFLWVVRNPPLESSSGAKEFELDDILPEGFLTRTKDKGLVVKNWAPQPAILGHESVGGFVSHCGWNSSLEAVVSGVPMVAWPLYAEQQMNRVYLVEEIKVALWLRMSADGFVGAEAVEETVRKLMEGEEGRAVREQILEMSGGAKAAVEDGGSSRLDFLKLTRPWTDQ
ncbi:putative isoflavone 7-O-glucosyltransferase [Helianthus annuus]|nr:putative isoflavone 7-O-glucosyltransferase [Helianthus annuus]KAJ0487811.1 putative isoflavone 7-O-glucosyltransferase [Helianthus annuus]